jgi:hypothetical protein
MRRSDTLRAHTLHVCAKLNNGGTERRIWLVCYIFFVQNAMCEARRLQISHRPLPGLFAVIRAHNFQVTSAQNLWVKLCTHPLGWYLHTQTSRCWTHSCPVTQAAYTSTSQTHKTQTKLAIAHSPKGRSPCGGRSFCPCDSTRICIRL